MFFFKAVEGHPFIPLQEYQTDLTFSRVSQVSDWSFIMGIYENIYLEAYIKSSIIDSIII